MIILGISPLDKDATVSLLVDGQVTWAIAEERLSRKKMHAGFPRQALQMVLDRAGIAPADVDHVMYAFYDWQTETNLMRRNVAGDAALNATKPRQSTLALIRQAQARLRPHTFAVPGLDSANQRMEKPWWKRFCYRLAAGDGPIGN